MNNPKVSVIIPIYNRADILPRTIKSVLNQTFKDFELIIVDDGSLDNTKEVVEEFQRKDPRIRYIWQENSGAPARPKNTGIKNAKGKYIAFLDHDDEWLPQKLEKQIKLFENSKTNIGFVGCNTLVLDEEKEKFLKPRLMLKDLNSVFKELLKGNFIFTSSSVVVKKEILDKIGFFDENLKQADDWDMWLRIAKKYKFNFVPEFLIKYYVYKSGITVNMSFEKEVRELEYIFIKHRNELWKYPNIYSIHLRQLASRYCAAGFLKKGRSFYIQSIKSNFKNLKSYLYLILSFLGKRIFRKLFYFRKSLNK